jgi:hypothetical protein
MPPMGERNKETLPNRRNSLIEDKDNNEINSYENPNFIN